MWGHVFRHLAAYAEGQLDAPREARVERHLARCDVCRASLEEIRRGVGLAARMSVEPMPDELAAHIRRELLTPLARGGSVRRWLPAAAAILAVAGTAVFWHVNRPWIQLHAAAAPPTRFESDGRRLHDRVRRGEVDVMFRSADERALWDWLAAQGAPITSLRAVRDEREQARFVPAGALVTRLADARTSVLSYRIDGHPVTLAQASARDVPDAPPAGWWSKRVIHRRDANGVNTLTWTVGGGTYVMVSELDGAGQRACSICHTDAAFVSRLDRLGR